MLFARPPQPKLALVDVATLVTTTADLLRGDPALEGGARSGLTESRRRASADAELLKIVFVNLLVNAAHAMQGRGTIRVSLAAIADMCQIAFADEGPGIPAEVLEKIFTPFFTTKVARIGSGSADGQAPHRGAPRHDQHRVSVRWRNDRHRPTAWRTPGRGDVGASRLCCPPPWTRS